jgi:hypothetical protein
MHIVVQTSTLYCDIDLRTPIVGIDVKVIEGFILPLHEHLIYLHGF